MGWEKLGDLSGCSSSDDIGDLLAKAYPGEAVDVIDIWKPALALHRDGDRATTSSCRPSICRSWPWVGLLTGPYEYRAAVPPGFRHVRRMAWVRLVDLSHWAVDTPAEDAAALAATGGLLELLKLVDHGPAV
ncbi:hypothetical protein [Streptomyces halstedii]|uniref:hypothetical protein n=1 Tax=Streptomyces halstedii TaxID=1944 RepID=UPI003683BD0D